MLTKYSLDLRLARDLQLGREAKEPQRPSIEGVLSLAEEKRREARFIINQYSDRLVIYVNLYGFYLLTRRCLHSDCRLPSESQSLNSHQLRGPNCENFS